MKNYENAKTMGKYFYHLKCFSQHEDVFRYITNSISMILSNVCLTFQFTMLLFFVVKKKKNAGTIPNCFLRPLSQCMSGTMVQECQLPCVFLVLHFPSIFLVLGYFLPQVLSQGLTLQPRLTLNSGTDVQADSIPLLFFFPQLTEFLKHPQ